MAAPPKLDSLEERLMDHAKSFDSLLSLMPADVYFGKDNSDQWQKKKQTKEEKRAAKKAKLDPDNVKTAKDVFDEQAANARKRKREEDGEGAGEMDENEQLDPDSLQNDKQGKKRKRDMGNAIQASLADTTALDEESRRAAKAEKARLKKDRKKAKTEKKAAKVEAKKARKQQEKSLVQDSEGVVLAQNPRKQVQHADNADDQSEESGPDNADIEPIEIDQGFADDEQAATASPSSPADRSVFDASNPDSGSSSISSIVPPTKDKSLSSSLPQSGMSDPKSATTMIETTTVQPDATPEALKARLAARIEALRTARKASDPSHAPQNRQELIESRRRKEEERKAHKKELRRKAKAEEAARHSETLARGSPLLSNTNSPLLLSPGSPASETANNNFSFNRISFAHPTNQSTLNNNKSTKGPSDPRTALIAAQTKQSRLSTLPASKQALVAEQDSWQRATQRAQQQQQPDDHHHHHAIKKDDTSLLKKTLKRKEKLKKKSEREWNERLEGVEKSQAARQKKREENLLKRREDKGNNNKKGGSKIKGGGGSSKKGKGKARPGFEGSFKAKHHHASKPSSAGNSGGGGGGGGGGQQNREKPRRR